MARIRIVDEWLRSPVAAPVRARVIMVVAETWSEQKVLMRAYATCEDQTRPGIVLHGAPLAIGPAGLDPHGPWGIDVDDNRDGRAQELRGQLELAARRLAGTKGNPPRLQDEVPSFETRPTNQWAPGAPRDRISQGPIPRVPLEPQAVASGPVAAAVAPAAAPAPAPVPATASGPLPDFEAAVAELEEGVTTGVYSPPQPAPAHRPGPSPRAAAAAAAAAYSSHPSARTVTPFGPHVPQGTPPPAAPAPRGRPARPTPLGWAVPTPASAPRRSRRSTFQRLHTPPPVQAPLGTAISHTMPLGFRLAPEEGTVLNRLGRQGVLTAREVSEIVGIDDAVAWMEGLMSRLAEHGLDIVAPGDDLDGEPTYVLRR